MKKNLRITRMGSAHVVVKIRHLEEMLDRVGFDLDDAGHRDECRGFAVYHRDAWGELLERIKGSSPASRLARGCDAWCGNVCRGNGGCDAAIGEPGECVAICNDGEVFIQ